MTNNNIFEIQNNVLIKFNGNETSVAIPNGVTKIGFSTFQGCIGLKTIKLPEDCVPVGITCVKQR